MSKSEKINLEESRFFAGELMPYISAALYGVKTLITNKLPAPAAITKHGRLLINEEMCSELPSEEIATILLHEISHLLNEHFDRAETFNAEPTRWNYAGDLEINDDLVTVGCKMPKFKDGGTILLPSQFGFTANQLAEEYYDSLKDKQLDKKHSCGSGAGNPLPNEGEFEDGTEGLTKEELERIKQDVASSIQEYQRTGGFVPGGMKRFAEKVLKGKDINWKSQLSKSMKKFVSLGRGIMNPSFDRISRRQHNSKDIIFPAYSSLTPKIGLLVDTSGSMSEKDLGEGIFQVKKILSQMPGIEIWMAVVDAEVHSVSRIKNVRDIDVKLIGGGGTVFVDVFKQLEERGVDYIVAISDCCATFPPEHPKAKVIWLCPYENYYNPPFGEVIVIKHEEM